MGPFPFTLMKFPPNSKTCPKLREYTAPCAAKVIRTFSWKKPAENYFNLDASRFKLQPLCLLLQFLFVSLVHSEHFQTATNLVQQCPLPMCPPAQVDTTSPLQLIVQQSPQMDCAEPELGEVLTYVRKSKILGHATRVARHFYFLWLKWPRIIVKGFGPV